MESREFLWSYWNLIKDASDTKIALTDYFSKTYELTQLQFLVMGQVDALEDTSIRSIAKSLRRDHGNISKICTVLEEKGFVYRKRSEYLPHETGRGLHRGISRHCGALYRQIRRLPHGRRHALSLKEHGKHQQIAQRVGGCESHSQKRTAALPTTKRRVRGLRDCGGFFIVSNPCHRKVPGDFSPS